IYVSGMIAWDEDRKIVGVGDPQRQTMQALENMRACLRAGGADFTDIVKITFYLTDIRDKAVVWEARKALFGDARCRKNSTAALAAGLRACALLWQIITFLYAQSSSSVRAAMFSIPDMVD